MSPFILRYGDFCAIYRVVVEGGRSAAAPNGGGGLFGMQQQNMANFSFQQQQQQQQQNQQPFGQQATTQPQFSFGHSNLFKQPEMKTMSSPFFGGANPAPGK